VLNWSSVLPAQADKAAAIDVSATPRSKDRRAINPVSGRGARGNVRSGDWQAHKALWKI
jgi:hypothetical protein